MKIGYIGLGNLGAPIAMNLLDSGHTLLLYNRTVSKTIPFKEKGAEVADSVASVAAACDIVFTMVSDDAALSSICEGSAGLIENMKAGGIHVSMSTILPGTAAQLAASHTGKKSHYLAAPVFGRPEAALAKKLNYVISGDEETRARIQPLLKDAGAAMVWDLGNDISASNTVKLCGNFLIASILEAIGESTALARRSSVDPVQMWNIFLQTFLNAPVYHTYSNIILKQQFKPAAFSMQLGLKDMKLVNEQAQRVGLSMPLAALLRSQMQQMTDAGKSQLDWSAVSTAAESNK